MSDPRIRPLPRSRGNRLVSRPRTRVCVRRQSGASQISSRCTTGERSRRTDEQLAQLNAIAGQHTPSHQRATGRAGQSHDHCERSAQVAQLKIFELSLSADSQPAAVDRLDVAGVGSNAAEPSFACGKHKSLVGVRQPPLTQHRHNGRHSMDFVRSFRIRAVACCCRCTRSPWSAQATGRQLPWSEQHASESLTRLGARAVLCCDADSRVLLLVRRSRENERK